jgi:dTDP-L-rhamnose 4-epimerase
LYDGNVAVTTKVLITGGGGFLGTSLARELLSRGCEVTILDNFNAQVHERQKLVDDLTKSVRLIRGDVRDPAAWQSSLPGQTCVVHLAAETGTGQSMYCAAQYAQVNIGGTALLYDHLAQPAGSQVERVVIASSRAVYGEGAYHCSEHRTVYPKPPSNIARSTGQFDPVCPICSQPSAPMATPEEATLQPVSFYGLTKQTQEQMALLFGAVRGIATTILRYQNVYGPGQSLLNPYTGILATFSRLARSGDPIEVFEDGLESRDFVFVDDAMRATANCITGNLVGQQIINIGSGERTSLLELATAVNAFYGGQSEVRVSGRFREGDIRHAVADLTRARSLLNFAPRTPLAEGLRSFFCWVAQTSSASEQQMAAHTRSLAELHEHGLLHG